MEIRQTDSIKLAIPRHYWCGTQCHKVTQRRKLAHSVVSSTCCFELGRNTSYPAWSVLCFAY